MGTNQMALLPLLVVSIFLCISPAQGATASSTPQQATLYRDGTAVLVEELSISKARAVIELPPATDLASVRVLARGRPTAGLGIETVYEESLGVERSVVGGVVVEKQVPKKELVGYRLHIDPAMAAGKGKLVLRYAVSGLGWQPRAEVDLVDGSRVSVALLAMVSNEALNLKDCKLQLASSAGQMPSKMDFGAHQAAANQTARAADLIYDVGSQTIAKGRSALLTVMAGKGRYERKHVWFTNTRERIRLMVRFSNPLSQPLCPALVGVYQDGVLLAQDMVEWAPPGSKVMLAAGHTHEVEVERSVDTTETPARRPRPFRHAIEFKVINRSSERISLAVVMPKKMGSRHKTIYKFKRKPDRRPGTLYVWELDLKAGKSWETNFYLDTEHPRFGDYNVYEKARHAL